MGKFGGMIMAGVVGICALLFLPKMLAGTTTPATPSGVDVDPAKAAGTATDAAGGGLGWLLDLWNQNPKMCSLVIVSCAIASVLIFLAKQITGTLTGIMGKFSILFGLFAMGLIAYLWFNH